MHGSAKGKIVFVVPPSSFVARLSTGDAAAVPLEGATIVATVLQHNGYEVHCYDLHMEYSRKGSLDQMLSEVLNEAVEADAVCIAGTPDAYPHIQKLASDIKNANSCVPIILGGALATFSWKTILTTTEIDFCILGEGENTLPDLISRLDAGVSLATLPVAWRLADGKPVAGRANKKEKPIDINKLPCPNYQIWENGSAGEFPELITYSTQRGCKGHCSFCANPWRDRWRTVCPDKVKKELVKFKAMGAKELYFNDPTFNTDELHCRNVIEIMRSLALPWSCCMRPEAISSELIHQMHECGCSFIFIGIESADQTILDMHSKGTRVDGIKRCLEAADKTGIQIIGFLILGLPGESEESLEKTKSFAFAHSFIPCPQFAVPYPGTRLFNKYLQTKQAYFRSEEMIEAVLLTKISQIQHSVTEVPIEILEPSVSVDMLTETMSSLMQLHFKRAMNSIAKL